MQIEFTPEASDSYNAAVRAIAGFTVEITPEDDVESFSEPFDAVIIGPDVDAGWAGTVRVRRFNEETSEAEGEAFSVVARSILVY
jgi:hypothetical protein